MKDSHQSASTSITAKLNDVSMRAKRSEIKIWATRDSECYGGEHGRRTRLFSLKTYGVPVESAAFVKEWLKTIVERIKSNMLDIGNYWTSRDCESRDSVTLIAIATYSDSLSV